MIMIDVLGELMILMLIGVTQVMKMKMEDLQKQLKINVGMIQMESVQLVVPNIIVPFHVF